MCSVKNQNVDIFTLNSFGLLLIILVESHLLFSSIGEKLHK